MYRSGLRLVSLLSVVVYLFANTQASFALDHWIRTVLMTYTQSAESAPTEESKPKPRKCKHCTTEENPEESVPCPSPCAPKGPSKPCNEPLCPGCPNDYDPMHCPCPGGCALCSVAKAPCLTPIDLNLHQSNCLSECLVIRSVQYCSWKCGGLDRPPRI